MYIIGIAGGTGSGKTTVVRKIIEALPPGCVSVIPQDSYYNDNTHLAIRVIQRDTLERGRTAQMVIDRYLKVLKPMHEEFIEPTKRYADLIIPMGGSNRQAIDIMRSYIIHRQRP